MSIPTGTAAVDADRNKSFENYYLTFIIRDFKDGFHRAACTALRV